MELQQPMKNRKGFTFIETMIVVGIVTLLATSVVVLVNPVKRFEDARDKQREIHLQTMLSAIEQKRTLEGGWFGVNCEFLPSATSTPLGEEEEEEGEMIPVFKTIGTKAKEDPENFYDLFSCLVPKYMPNHLYDPDGGDATNTHYQVWQNPQTKYITLCYVKEEPYKEICVGAKTYHILSEPRNVVTGGISNEGHNTAIGGGTVNDDGGAYISEAGVIWAKADKFASPDEAEEELKFDLVDMEEVFRTADAEGMAELNFISNIHSLQGGKTLYYVRAYAKNEIGVGYGGITWFETLDGRPDVTTLDPEVGYDMAVIKGVIETLGINTVSEAYFCWDLVDSGDFDGEVGDCPNYIVGDGAISITIEPFPFSTEIDLSAFSVPTTFSFQACGINNGTPRCGEIKDFTTTYSAPFVETLEDVEDITAYSAVAKGEVKSNGGQAISWRGICFHPTDSDNPCSFDQPDGDDADWCVEETETDEWVIGEFSVTIDYNLEPGESYRICALARNDEGLSHGDPIPFNTTISSPYNITTNAATNIGPSSAVSGGNIEKSGGVAVTLRGVCWREDPTDPKNTFPAYKPEDDPKCTEDGAGTGPFISDIPTSLIGLWGGREYNIRAYAVNDEGIGWGDMKTFWTAGIESPTLSPTELYEVGMQSFSAGGYIEDHGGAPIGQVGIICWNDLTGEEYGTSVPVVPLGGFSVEVTSLQPGTPYSIQAFARNQDPESGEGYFGYGDPYYFYTLSSEPPQVGPTNLSAYGADWAEFTGNVTSSDPFTIRGICYSSSTAYTYPNYLFRNEPEVVCIEDDEQGEDDITIQIEGLKRGVEYYALLYATNNSGAGLGLGDPPVEFEIGLELGESCINDDDCKFGHCTDEVCCDSACTGICKACAASKTGGSDGTCANITSNTDPDEECTGTCQVCKSGACSNATVDTDPENQCAAVICTNYIYDWSGNYCKEYSGSSSRNGMCNSSGDCYTAVADSCSGVGNTSASCGSSNCKKACVANALATSYNTVDEVCYTSGQQTCSTCYICNASGSCTDTITNWGANLYGCTGNNKRCYNSTCITGIEYYLYLTDEIYKGYLGGRTGADAKCNADANEPTACTQPGWAFISVKITDEIQDFPSPTSKSVATVLPWFWRKGDTERPAAINWYDLLDGSIINSAGVIDEYWGVDYWTGSTVSGALDVDNCFSWQSDSSPYYGQRGWSNYQDSRWLTLGRHWCGTDKRILCACIKTE